MKAQIIYFIYYYLKFNWNSNTKRKRNKKEKKDYDEGRASGPKRISQKYAKDKNQETDLSGTRYYTSCSFTNW